MAVWHNLKGLHLQVVNATQLHLHISYKTTLNNNIDETMRIIRKHATTRIMQSRQVIRVLNCHAKSGGTEGDWGIHVPKILSMIYYLIRPNSRRECLGVWRRLIARINPLSFHTIVLFSRFCCVIYCTPMY